jgi:hypothetical protein
MIPQPKRIQRQRTKGWRMPANTVYVGRPSAWGNPYRVGRNHPVHSFPMSAGETVALFRAMWTDGQEMDADCAEECLSELRGKNLACWCPLDQPCHADVYYLNLLTRKTPHDPPARRPDDPEEVPDL